MLKSFLYFASMSLFGICVLSLGVVIFTVLLDLNFYRDIAAASLFSSLAISFIAAVVLATLNME